MYHKIKKVTAGDNFVLYAEFTTGEKRQYDVKQLFDKRPQFLMLKDVKGLFPLVKVDAGGYGVCWNDELDLDSEEIYDRG